jgi:hypothetical protein
MRKLRTENGGESLNYNASFPQRTRAKKTLEIIIAYSNREYSHSSLSFFLSMIPETR